MKKNSLDEQYLKLVKKIMSKGTEKMDRTETGTISIFGEQIRHDMSEGFPLLTSKQMSLKNIATELNWFISGSTDIRDLWKSNCHIWDGDAYKRYAKEYMEENPVFSGPYPHFFTKEEFIEKVIAYDTPFAGRHAELGPIYGSQWRNFNNQGIDQIKNLIKDINENPDSRRLIVTAWNPAQIKDMILPPCHYGFQCYTRELNANERLNIYKSVGGDSFIGTYSNNHIFNNSALQILKNANIPTRELSLMWNQRSVDTLLGLPYNIASYGLLLLLLCKQTNCVPGELIGNLGDTHIYKDQLSYVQKQLDNETFDLPTVTIDFPDSQSYEISFKIENYQNAGRVYYPLSN